MGSDDLCIELLLIRGKVFTFGIMSSYHRCSSNLNELLLSHKLKVPSSRLFSYAFSTSSSTKKLK